MYVKRKEKKLFVLMNSVELKIKKKKKKEVCYFIFICELILERCS